MHALALALALALHCTALALALALALLLTVMLTAMSALALSVKAAMLEADLRHAFRWEDGQGRLRAEGRWWSESDRSEARMGWKGMEGEGWRPPVLRGFQLRRVVFEAEVSLEWFKQ